MYCKLCGNHLYKRITFKNIFKMNYCIHEECELLLNQNKDYITIPFLDKLVLCDYLFEEYHEHSDQEYLYQKYSNYLFERMLSSKEWSIVFIADNTIDEVALLLVTKLAEKALLIMSVFYENIL